MSSMSMGIRTLLIYVICIPVALFLGLQINSLSYFSKDSIYIVSIVVAVLISPILLKWHHPLLFFFLNATVFAWFLPGRPKLGLVLAAISLTISVLQRTVQHESRFIRAPEITRPLLVLIAVVVTTMLLRGGLGFSAFGSKMVGGSRYLILILGALSFYALTAQPIPRARANTYIALFFLCGITSVMGDLFALATPTFYPIFLFFPPSAEAGVRSGEAEIGVTRLIGLALMCGAIFRYMLARYGLKEMLTGANKFRLLLFLAVTIVSLLGGFRSIMVGLILMFGMMFILEGIHRTRIVVPVVIGGLLISILTVAMLPKMPFTVQRALAFLPVEIDPVAKMSASISTEWRVEMWKSILPEVPNYLLLGKGLGFSDSDYETIVNKDEMTRNPDSWTWAVITGEFHNGPLSVVLTFGVWGLIAFGWLQIAGLRALYANYRHGDPELRCVNTYVLASYVVQLIMFWFVFGSMYSETVIFVSLMGFSVAINHGIHRAVAPAPARFIYRHPRALPNPAVHGGQQPAPDRLRLTP